MKPCTTPQLSSTTLTTGTRQFVVQEALERTWCLAGSYFFSFTPMQIVMSSPLAGAEITTFFAPAVRCLAACSRSVKRPVLSSTSSTPSSFHGSFSGSLIAVTRISRPFTTRLSPLGSTVPGIVLEEVGERLGIGDVVDAHEFQVGLFRHDGGPQHIAPDTSEPVDPYANGHAHSLIEVRYARQAEGDGRDRLDPRARQRAGRFCQRRAGGEHVVNQDNCGLRIGDCGFSGLPFTPQSEIHNPHSKSPRHVR